MQELRFGYRLPDPRLQNQRQCFQGLRSRQLLVQPKHDLVERQQLAHLAVQPGIGERTGRELVAQETADGVLGRR